MFQQTIIRIDQGTFDTFSARRTFSVFQACLPLANLPHPTQNFKMRGSTLIWLLPALAALGAAAPTPSMELSMLLYCPLD